MANDYTLVQEFNGYRNKKDETSIGSTFLVNGSLNTIINDGEKVQSRKGYTLDGPSNSSRTPVKGSFEWQTSTGPEWPIRYYDDEVEYRDVSSDGTVSWNRLIDGMTTANDVRFSTVWDSTEVIDLLLFVNGDNNLYEWSGGVAEVDSVTSNSITKTGTETWAEARFYTGRDKTIIIDGIEYTYTGGESTTTLTGVSPDPSSNGVSSGDRVRQKVVTNSATPASGVNNDIIHTLNNQVYIADLNRRDVYISANDDWTDYTFSSPRLPGEGGLLTLDTAPNGFAVQEDSMYISGKKDDWYVTNFKLSSDNQKEFLTVQKLKTGSQQGAVSPDLIAKIKNDVAFVSNEPTLDLLGRLEDVDTPQSRPISDVIKNDFDDYNFNNGHALYFKNKLYILAPIENRMLIYDLEKKLWNPPQVVPFNRLAIINGELYAHSSEVAETYKVFDGTTDNGAPIRSVACFSYRNYGDRANLKNFDEWYTEGYIGENTTITMRLRYEYNGDAGFRLFNIEGSDNDITFGDQNTGKVSIGKEPLGHQPLGSVTNSNGTSGVTDNSKFRVIHETARQDFYEIQVEYETDQVGAEWQLLAQGGNVVFSTNNNQHIKQS